MLKRPLRIAVANDQIFPIRETDAEQIVSSMAALGAKSGIFVDLLLPVKRGESTPTAAELSAYYEVDETFEVVGQRSIYPSFRGAEKIGHALACLRNSAFKRCDVFYTRNLPAAFSALLFSEKPVVYETFRPWPDQQPLLKTMLARMTTHRRFLGTVTHSRFAGKSFVSIGMPEEKLLTAHNGYSPKRMQPILSKEQARAQLGLSSDGHIVSYVGHVNMNKGLGIMLGLAEKLPETRFIIVGSENDEGEVERAARRLANVQIVPWQPFSATVPYLYASDVLFIPPSAGPLKKVGNTVLPIKTFLYMASGRAIFGPATADLEEVLEGDRNAVLVTPDDEGAALSGLKRLLDDTMFREGIAAAALADVGAMTWDARADRIVSFIDARLAACDG